MRIGKKRISYNLLIILIVLMPLHYVLFSLTLGKMKVLSLWRDAIIFLLFAISCKDGKMRMDNYGKAILSIMVMTLIFLLTNLNPLSINVARTYVLPMLIFFPVSKMDLKNEELNQLLKAIWIVTVLVSIYGIIQAYFLGPEFLIQIGYASRNGRLESSSFYIMNNLTQQRVCGTFVSPNTCGAYLSVTILILFFLRDRCDIKRPLYYIGLCIIVLALISTLSRSAWVGCVTGIILITDKRINPNKAIKTLFIFLVCVLIVLFIDKRFLGGRILTIALQQIKNTLTRRDSSAEAHLKYLYKPIEEVISYPFGYKFGTNGSFVLQSLMQKDVHLAESSIYTICYEFGAFGAFLFFLPYFMAMFHRYRKPYTYISKVAAGIGICLFTIYIFLPSIQAFEQPFYFYFFLGLGISYINMERKGILKGNNYARANISTY